jgi:toxin FitB
LVKEILIDTSVLSALAPGKMALSDKHRGWFQGNAERLHISSITVAEVEQGIAKLRRLGGAARAERLAAWLDVLVENFGPRILPLDVDIARLAGRMSDLAIAIGRHPGFPGIAIAAAARLHGMELATRNARHFEPLGVAVIDPFGDVGR